MPAPCKHPRRVGCFPWLGNAVIQPLERSARNCLFQLDADRMLCGLCPFGGWQGGREKASGESEMSPGVGETTGEGSPHGFAGTRADTRGCARKKANRERLTFRNWWWDTEPNPRPLSEPDSNARVFWAWIRRFGRTGHRSETSLIKRDRRACRLTWSSESSAHAWEELPQDQSVPVTPRSFTSPADPLMIRS